MSSFVLDVASAKKQLKPLFRLINESSVLPILGDVLISKGEQFYFCTSDLENYLKIKTVPIVSDGDVNFCLNAKAFKQLLNKSLSDTLEVSAKKDHCVARNGSFSLKWPIENADDFPKMPVLEEFDALKLNVNDLRHNFSAALKFVSNDYLRPAITGICLGDWDGSFYVAATDAHRLYFSQVIKTPKKLTERRLIIPKKSILSFLEIFTQGEVEIKVSKNYISFENETYLLITRLIESRYPDWKTVVPVNDIEFSMQRKNLISFLRMADIFVNGTNRQLVLVINNSGIAISGGDRDFDNEFNYKMPIYNCNKKFPPFRFGLNLRFLLDIALISNDEYCKFSHSGLPHKAMIIDEKCLVMPLQLNDID